MMISGSSRESEILASLNVAEALLVALRRKGILTEAEINDLLTEVSASMSSSALAEAKGAAHIVETMREAAMTQ